MTSCRHCGDPVARYDCPLCGRRIISSCGECHAELAHDIIGPPMESLPARPDRATAVDLAYHGTAGRGSD